MTSNPKRVVPVKTKRFRQETQLTRRGFCRWVQPRMEKYLLACCDCNLVHEMQFRVVGVRKKRVQFRVRRAEGYTRRERKRHGILGKDHGRKSHDRRRAGCSWGDHGRR